MSRPTRIPFCNRSPYGWWIASYLERFEWKSENRRDLGRRCLAYENTVLIKAKDRESAFRKTCAISKDYSKKWQAYGEKLPGRPGRWVYEGITSLLPIYEELEHGAEILWRVHSNRRVKTIQSRVKKKSQLETFVD